MLLSLRPIFNYMNYLISLSYSIHLLFCLSFFPSIYPCLSVIYLYLLFFLFVDLAFSLLRSNLISFDFVFTVLVFNIFLKGMAL